MCGIAGLVALERNALVDATTVRSMVASLAHRGPDDSGFYDDETIAFGMARLSIIDLNTGRQPIANEDGSVWVVLNGEIYNFSDLRTRLEARGHTFRTRADTETIVHGYEEYGDSVVDHLRGMFAFALWDARRRRLLLARDRVGEKPLFIARVGDALAFASELKALASTGYDEDIDLEALDEYLSFGFIGAPRTIFRGVRKLRPGHILTVADGRVAEHRYWRPNLEPGPWRSLDEVVEEARPLVEDAVRSQMVSDAPLGAFLSGGLDSSTIVALMTRVSNSPVKTFCVGFEHADFDERPFARSVSQHLGTVHEDWILTPDVARDLPDLVRHFDEPFGDKSLVPVYYVAQAARRHVKVVLSGDGGDEVFAGYVSYLSALERRRRHAKRPAILDWAVRKVAGLAPVGAPGAFRLRKRSLDHWARWVAGSLVFDPDDKRSLYSKALRAQLGAWDPFAPRALHFDEAKGVDLLSALQYDDVMHYLPDDILAKVDRMTMRASLESRAPLLDHRLVELALRVPETFKISGGVTKLVLRRIADGLLPAEILQRPKKGFALPMRPWLSGELRRLLRDVLLGSRLTQSGWFRPQALARIANAAGAPLPSQSWLLLCLGLWLER